MKRLRISVEGKTYEVEVELLDEGFASPAPRSVAPSGSARVAAPVAAPVAAKAAPVVTGEGDGVVSPLAAVVVSADVAVGDAVTEGQTVITLEAMKMNTIVGATAAGTVTAILVKAGDAVEEGQIMVTIA
ncbi:MAG: biotin carboxyl carrier protein [Lentimonas sp.]|jgi:biotin carboxyl carrier protein